MKSRAGKWLSNALFYTLTLLLVFLLLSQFGVLPFRLMYVRTGSMVPTYLPGDAVFVQVGNNLTIQPGDVIFFQKGGDPVIHRAVSIGQDGVVTRGDANNANDAGTVTRVEGKVLFGIPKIGYAIDAVQSLFRPKS